MNPKFDAVKRDGYNMEQVDKYIAHLRGEYEKVAEGYNQLQARVAELETLEDEKLDIARAMVVAQTYAKNIETNAMKRAEKIITDTQIQVQEIIAALCKDRLQHISDISTLEWSEPLIT